MEAFAPTTYATVQNGDTLTISLATLDLGPAELLIPSEDKSGYLRLDVNSAESYFGFEKERPILKREGPIDVPFSLEDILKFGFNSGDVVLVDDLNPDVDNLCVICNKKLSDKFKLKRHLVSVHNLPESSVTMAFSIPVSSTSHPDTRSEKSNKETFVSDNDDLLSLESMKDERNIKTETMNSQPLSHQRSSNLAIEIKKSGLVEKLSDQSKVPRIFESKKSPATEITSVKLTVNPDRLKQSSTRSKSINLDSNSNLTRRVSGRHSSLEKIKDEPVDPKSQISKENLPDKSTSPKKMNLTNQAKNAVKSPNTPKLLKPTTKSEVSRKRSLDGLFKCSKCDLKFQSQAHLTLHALKNHSSQNTSRQSTITDDERHQEVKEVVQAQTEAKKSTDLSIQAEISNLKENMKCKLNSRHSDPMLQEPKQLDRSSSVSSEPQHPAKRKKFHYFEPLAGPANQLKCLLTLLEAIHWKEVIARDPEVTDN